MGCISLPTAGLVSGGLGALGIFSGLLGKSTADRQLQATLQQLGITRAELAPFAGAGVSALGEERSLTGTQAPRFSPTADVLSKAGVPSVGVNTTNVAKLKALEAQGYKVSGTAGHKLLNPTASNPLEAPLTKPFQPTMDQLAATPGYKFALQQGELATQNQFAGQGLGQSGAFAKGSAQFAEGLASETYQQQFGNYLAQNQQIYNMLGGISSLGENAAATSGSQGLGFQAQANALGITGAQALGAGVTGAAGSAGSAALISALNNSGMFANQSGGTGT